MATLCITENKETGNKRYYIDGKRVNRERFELAKLWKTQDCLHTVRTKKLIKYFSCVR